MSRRRARGARGPAAGTAGARGGPPRPAARPLFQLHGQEGVSDLEVRWLTRAAWLLAVLLGATLLVMAFGRHPIGDYMAESDFYGAYADGARLVQSGHLVPARYGVIGPVYEVTLALAAFLTRDLFAAAKLLSVLATVGTLLLWFHLLRRRANSRLALLTAVFLAATPSFFLYGYVATTDALGIALQAAALFLLLGGTGGRRVAAAGAVSGLAFLTRYNAIYLLPVGLIAALGGAAGDGRRWRCAGLFALGFAAPVLPWVLFSLAHGQQFRWQLQHNVALEVFARPRGLTWDDYETQLEAHFPTPWSVIARDPVAVLTRLAINVFDHPRLDAEKLLGWPTAACAAAGLLLLALRQDRALRRLWPVWVAGGLLFLTLVPVFHSERYSLALLPVYAALAAGALVSPRVALAVGRGGRVWLKPALAIVPLWLSAGASIRLQAQEAERVPVEVLECARAGRAWFHPGERVIARKGHFGYYTGLTTLMFPHTNELRQLGEFARREHARWLYVSWAEMQTRPGFVYLLDTTAAVPGLMLRHASGPGAARLYQIGPGFGAFPEWYDRETPSRLHRARTALQVNPRDPHGMLDMGNALYALGDFREARLYLERSTQADPTSLMAWLLLGKARLHLGEFAAADQAFENADLVRPGVAEAREGHAWAALLAGRREQAARLWRPLVPTMRDPALLERMLRLYRDLNDAPGESVATATLAQLKSRHP